MSTKYRKPFLHYFDSDLKYFLSIASNKVDISIKEIDIMPDHIHISFKCNNKLITIPKIVQQLKGFSSFSIRNKYPDLRTYKSFWSPSYFIESIGNISEKVIRKYIQNQKKKR
jgi:putative transposase